ncbi:MAG: DUF4097 family beta strand repeat-containing protein [Chrysiogenales bacterium]
MKQKIKYVLFILLFMFSLLAAEDYEQKISRRFDLTPNGIIELANINGGIVITTTTGSAIDVKAVKKSDYKGEIESVEVIFETGKDALKIYTKYNKKNTRAKVDFTVVVPEKLSRAIFKSINGALDCQGIFAELNLKSVNGRIKFSGDFASASLSAVNGAVEVSQETQLNGDLSVESVNGAINIEVNRKSAFTVKGQTVNGGIRNDFGLNVSHHFVGSSFNGQVNGGGHKITLETVNGRITISKI